MMSCMMSPCREKTQKTQGKTTRRHVDIIQQACLSISFFVLFASFAAKARPLVLGPTACDMAATACVPLTDEAVADEADADALIRAADAVVGGGGQRGGPDGAFDKSAS